MLKDLVRAVATCTAAMSFVAAAGAEEPDPWFARISARAGALAAEAHRPPAEVSVPALKTLSYDQYRDIRFRKDHALWRGAGRFEVEFFHPGFLYPSPVTINLIENDSERRLPFDSAMFDYGKSGVPGALPADMGFAGFRVHYPLNSPNYKDEVVTFLGASYFRLLARGQLYGISARGLAINTALPSGEEFPIFREFWLVKPALDAVAIRIYALLDSKSVTGAYRFDLEPGGETVTEVRTELYFRADVERLGLAPLNSMFLHGRNPVPPYDDYRPEVHDSDGLLLRSMTEWTWRPLTNPTALRVSSFTDQNLLGFGLLQRERGFERYLDLESRYERRPSMWVEPVGDAWQAGATHLVEIPSKEEIHDNIVAFWSPPGVIKAGTKLAYQYRLRTNEGPIHPLASISRTAIGWAAVPGVKNPPPRTVRRVVIGFRGGELAGLDETFPIEAKLTVSAGTVKDLVIQKEPSQGAWRVSFQLAPDGEKPSDMRLFLLLNGKRLSETWSYVLYPKDYN